MSPVEPSTSLRPPPMPIAQTEIGVVVDIRYDDRMSASYSDDDLQVPRGSPARPSFMWRTNMEAR